MNNQNLDKKLEKLDSKNKKLEKLYEKRGSDDKKVKKEIEDFINYCLNERQNNHTYPKYTIELSRNIMYWGERFY